MGEPEADSEALEKFECTRQSIFTLYKVVEERNQRSQKKWLDDRSMLQDFIQGITSTRDIVRAEQKRLLEELSSRAMKLDNSDVNLDLFVALEEQRNELSRIQMKIKEVEKEEEEVRCQMSNRVRGPELEIWETKLAVLQDVRKMCADEMEQITREINKMEKAGHKRKAVNQVRAQLVFLRDQLTRLEAKLDTAKRMLYFPAAKGYRFRAGSAGVYVGAKDVHILDMSGSFFLATNRSDGKTENGKTGNMRLRLEGASLQSEDIGMQPLVTRTSSTTSQPHTISKVIPRLARRSTGHSQTTEHSIPPLLTQSLQFADQEENSNRENEAEIVSQSKWATPNVEVRGEPSRAKKAAVKLLNIVATKDRRQHDQKSNSSLKSEASKTGSRAGLIKRFMTGKRKGTNGKVNLKKEFTDNLKNHSINASPPRDVAILVDELLDNEAEGSPENSGAPVMDPPAFTEDGSSFEYQVSPHSASEVAESPRRANPFPPTAANTSGGIPVCESRTEGNVKSNPEVWSEQTPAASSSRTNIARRGVYMKVKAQHFDLIGEKGSRVPNISVKEILLEVECLLSVDLEYSESKGWEFRGGVVFEIVDAKKQVIGNSLPFPLGLVKTVLNLLLPKLVERILLTNLPVEFGEYLLDSGSDGMISGEIAVVGPPLGTMQADIDGGLNYATDSRKSRTEGMKKAVLAKEAMALLGISTTEASLLSAAFGGDEAWRLSEAQTKCTIAELCEFHLKFLGTDTWDRLCSLWDQGLKSLAVLKGYHTSVDFKELMNGIIKDLAAKPMRIKLIVTRLNAKLDIDAMLMAFRDYVERSAQELDGSPVSAASGSGVPLDEQLKALDLWHQQCSIQLSGFKSKFKSASCTIVGTADSSSVDLGLDRVQYDGPVKLQVPISSKEDDMLTVDISVPLNDPRTKMSAIASGIKEARHSFKDIASRLQNTISMDQLNTGNGGADEIHESSPWRLPIGRLLLHRLSVGLCVNESGLARMLLGSTDVLSSTPCVSPVGLQQMLGSLGDLISFRLAPTHGNRGKSPYLLSLESGELTRLRLDLESVGFQSSISPAILMRGLQAFVSEMLSSWPSSMAKLSAVTSIVFSHILKYIDRQSLDLGVCGQFNSRVSDSRLLVFINEIMDSESGSCRPVHFVNDVDLMALVDIFGMEQGQISSLSVR